MRVWLSLVVLAACADPGAATSDARVTPPDGSDARVSAPDAGDPVDAANALDEHAGPDLVGDSDGVSRARYGLEPALAGGTVIFRRDADGTRTVLVQDAREIAQLCVHAGEVYAAQARGRDRQEVFRLDRGRLVRHAWAGTGVAVGHQSLACDRDWLVWFAIAPTDSGPLVSVSRRRGGRARVIYRVEPDSAPRQVLGLKDGQVLHGAEGEDDAVRTPAKGGRSVAVQR